MQKTGRGYENSAVVGMGRRSETAHSASPALMNFPDPAPAAALPAASWLASLRSVLAALFQFAHWAIRSDARSPARPVTAPDNGRTSIALADPPLTVAGYPAQGAGLRASECNGLPEACSRNSARFC